MLHQAAEGDFKLVDTISYRKLKAGASKLPPQAPSHPHVQGIIPS
jgi:hypothetical protein